MNTMNRSIHERRYTMNTQHEHMAEATMEIIANLRTLSAGLLVAESNLMKRFVLACDWMREAGADFSGDWETEPSPLQQVIEAMSDQVRHVSFNHSAGTLTLHPEAVAETAPMLPLDWFDEALLMVDSQWGVEYYPYTPVEAEVAQ